MAEPTNSKDIELSTPWKRYIIHHYGRIFVRSFLRPALLFFVILGNVILFSCATLFWKFEFGVNPNVNSYWDALWWGVTTVTTVGYGDIYPVTDVGRVIAMFLMIVGVTFFLSFTAILVSFYFEIINEDTRTTEKLLLQKIYDLEQKLTSIEKRLQKD